MRFVIQRVTEAKVEIEGKTVGSIGQGLLVLVGVSQTDTHEVADKLIKKLLGLRIFAYEDGKTNLSLSDVGGGLLMVSQFTLYADCRHANRPGFTAAGAPDMANELYEYILAECGKQVTALQHGEFGADMQVSLVNDGPFTIILDSEEFISR